MKTKWLLLWLLASTVTFAKDYTTAEPGYAYTFPRDAFNHEDYQTEWWYYTGNVRSPDGHRFGYELTFFRQGISREAASNPWYVNDVWMAHIALSDVSGGHFYYEERLNRSGPGMAGVDAGTGMIWNGNLHTHISGSRHDLQGTAGPFSFALALTAAKPWVIQGQNGASQKAEGAGHASHYLSLTRMLTNGSIRLAGKTWKVEGNSWMDHEFFTGSMAENETGWDWVSIQLEDGADLMLYRLRHVDGTVDPYSSGSYVDAAGKSQFLSAQDFRFTPSTSDSWTSPATRASYPERWHVSIPRSKMELDITVPLKNQEIASRFGTSYWEGAIDIMGERDHAAVRGVGYLEMVGYSGSGKPVIPR